MSRPLIQQILLGRAPPCVVDGDEVVHRLSQTYGDDRRLAKISVERATEAARNLGGSGQGNCGIRLQLRHAWLEREAHTRIRVHTQQEKKYITMRVSEWFGWCSESLGEMQTKSQ